LFEHDLFGKQASTFPDHALAKKAPEHPPGHFLVVNRRQVRVRIRIMKLSKLNSATWIQGSDSFR
jgi:hypothetical protein